MGTLGQFITLLLVIGVVGAYFWPIALTLAAAWVAYRVVLQAIDSESRASVHDDKLRTAVRNSSSGVIPPLVLGSRLTFTDRGEHELKGVPGPWRVLAVDDS